MASYDLFVAASGQSSIVASSESESERNEALEALPWLVQNLWAAYNQKDNDRMVECISTLFEAVSDVVGRKVSAKPGNPLIYVDREVAGDCKAMDDLGGVTSDHYTRSKRKVYYTYCVDGNNPWKLGDRVRVKKNLMSVYRGALPFGDQMKQFEGLAGTVTAIHGSLTWVSSGPDMPVFPWHHSALVQNTEVASRWKDIANDVCPTPYEPHQMHKAICNNCGNRCDVPFKPDGRRPIYCRPCYRKRERTARAAPKWPGLTYQDHVEEGGKIVRGLSSCIHRTSDGTYVCTRPMGHEGWHEAATGDGALRCSWESKSSWESKT